MEWYGFPLAFHFVRPPKFPGQTHVLTYETLQGRLPALGWDSWNAYGCAVTEANVMTTVNLMVQNGLKAAGYEYVNREHAGHYFS